jgi:hypothetical protein
MEPGAGGGRQEGKKPVWLKVALLLLVLLPLLSTLCYFVYFWLHGVTIAK